MEEPSVAELLPELYREVLDRVAALEDTAGGPRLGASARDATRPTRVRGTTRPSGSCAPSASTPSASSRGASDRTRSTRWPPLVARFTPERGV